jgi:hypothetical protein
MELSPGSVQDKRDGDRNVGNRGATKGGWSGDPENDSEDELPPLVSDSDSEDESLKVALYGRSPPLNTRPYWVIIRRKASIDEEMRLSQGPVQDKHDGDGDHHSRSAGRQASTETSGPLQLASEEGVWNCKTPNFGFVRVKIGPLPPTKDRSVGIIEVNLGLYASSGGGDPGAGEGAISGRDIGMAGGAQ